MGNRAGCAHAAQYVGARHERKGRPSQPLLLCVVRDEAEEGGGCPGPPSRLISPPAPLTAPLPCAQEWAWVPG